MSSNNSIKIVRALLFFVITAVICGVAAMAAPTISLETPPDGTWAQSQTPTFTFNFTDSDNNTMRCDLILNDSVILYGYNESVINATPTSITANASIPVGNYLWTVNCTQDSNLGTATPYLIHIDNAAPTVSINTSLNNTYTQSPNPAVDFNFSDTQSPNATCTLYFDDAPYNTSTVVANTPVTLVPNSTIPEGTHIVYINCTDLAMNTGKSDEIYINIDSTPPNIVISTSDTNTTDNTTSITFSFTDSISTSAACILYFNEASVGSNATTLNNTPTIIISSEQNDGTYSVVINCTDQAGLMDMSNEITVKIDTQLPSIAISSLSSDTVLTASQLPFNVSGTVSDIGIGVANVTFYLNGAYVGPIESSNPPNWYHNWNPTNGVYNLTFRACDYVGLCFNASVTNITVDSNAPIVTLATADTNTSSTAPQISFNFTDAMSGTASCVLYFDGNSVASNSSTINATTTNLTPSPQTAGTYTAYVNCTDGVGQIGKSNEITVKIDTDNPSVSISDPAPDAWTNDNTTAITFTFTDSMSPSANCTILADGSPAGSNASVLNNTPTIIYISPALSDYIGHVILVNCTDIVGSNSGASSPQNLNVDATPPVVTPLSPDDSNITTITSPDFVFSFTDSIFDNATCTLYLNGGAYGTNSTTWNATSTTITANNTLGQGSYIWTVNCTDAASNIGATNARTIHIDTGAPNVNIVNSSFNTTDNTTSITFNFTDEISTTASCVLYFDGTNVGTNTSVLNNTNTVITSSEQAEGLYTMYINCTDMTALVGKSNEISVRIDKTGPAITIISPYDGQHQYSNTTSVTFSIADTYSPYGSCTLVVNGTIYGTNSSVWDSTVTTITNDTEELAEGNYNFYINCTDDLSNLVTSDTLSFVVDRTAPEVTEVSASGTSSSTTTGTATITATTNESATCWYSESNFTAENTTDATEMSGSGTASHSFEVAYSANGNIGPYYISCRDTAGNNMTSSYVTEEYAVSVTERRSGGGGGGGGSITYNPSVSHSWAKITPGAASIMKVASDDFGIKQITILVKNPALSINIVVEKLPGRPAEVTKTITGKVFRYLKINTKNLDNSNLKGNAQIEFKVPLSWLSTNGVEAKNIALKRFVDDEWKDLWTTLLNTDSAYAYYRAETPGFSYFAIGEKSAEPVAVPKVEELITAPAEEEEVTGEVVAPVAPAEKKPAAPATSQSSSNTGVQIAIVVIVVAAIGLIILSSTKKRKGLKPIKEIRG